MKDLLKQNVNQGSSSTPQGYGKSYIAKHFQYPTRNTTSPQGGQPAHQNSSSSPGALPGAGLSAFRDDKVYITGLQTTISTKMTSDRKYYVLEPTLSLDNGPNCKAKVYNEVRLMYGKGDANAYGERRLLNYAEAKCLVEIPVIRLPATGKKRHIAIDAENVDSKTG